MIKIVVQMLGPQNLKTHKIAVGASQTGWSSQQMSKFSAKISPPS